MFVEQLQQVEENYFDQFFDEDDLVNDRDYSDVSKESIDFAKDIFDLIQDIITDEEKLQEGLNIKEEFTSESSAQVHFDRHCLQGNPRRRSCRTRVYYDFEKKCDYLAYEAIVNDEVHRVTAAKNRMYIIDLLDTSKVFYGFRKLFEGNQTLVFGLPCGFTNEQGRVSVGFHSFASDVTENYRAGNTVDFIIQTPGGKTITLYPLDINYVEQKFNNKVAGVGIDPAIYDINQGH